MCALVRATGSPIPDPNRAGPSTLVRAGGQLFLVDCGRGVLQRAAAVGVGASGLSALLLTHLHSDHIAELGDLLITRWITTFTPDPAPLPIIEHGAKVPEIVLYVHLPTMLLVLVLFRVFISRSAARGKFRRWYGVPLLLLYVAYTVTQYVIS